MLIVRNSEEDIKKEIARLKLAMEEFNKIGKREYRIYFSVGYGMGRGDENMEKVTLDSLLKTSDINMYADKKINHEANSFNI